MNLPIYDLIINEKEADNAEVSFVALVDAPAIKRDFLAFIDPTKGESKEAFMPRCISYVINEGKNNEQAVAICNSLWEQHFAACPIATQDIKINLKNRGTAISVAMYGPANPSLPNEQYWIDKAAVFGGSIDEAKTMTCNNCAAFNRSPQVLDCIAKGLGENTAADPWATIEAGDLGYCEIFDFKCASSRTCNAWVAKSQQMAVDSYNDYPQQATENAKIALRWAEENGWGSCGTPVGKARANQLANKEPISRDTIARMSSFARQKENSNKKLGDGCGRLMWLAWGGDAGIEWASKKLQQIDKNNFAGNKVSFDYDDTLSTSRGKELAAKQIADGNTVYIISARQDKEGMLLTAKDLGIPESRVYATGSNKAKVEKIKELNISKHYDNNANVIKELGSIGNKFEQMIFAIQNEDEHIITGPLMIPQQLIYRNSQGLGEHYVKFTTDTIKQIAIKFAKKGYQKNVNLMHDENLQMKGITMFESFISDSKRGIKPIEAFKDLPDGTWFGSFYVENNEVWQLVKDGKVKGFSVEGMFDYEQPKSNDEIKLQELKNILNKI